jgi:hypothetical protein
LGSRFFVVNRERGGHWIKFNKSVIHPHIVKGWDDLENYHGFPEDVLIEFRYYRDNVLSIQSFSLVDFPSATPSFHSRSGDPQETFGFDIRLTDNDVAKSKLVK